MNHVDTLTKESYNSFILAIPHNMGFLRAWNPKIPLTSGIIFDVYSQLQR